MVVLNLPGSAQDGQTEEIFTSSPAAGSPDGHLSLAVAADHRAFRGGQQHFKNLLGFLEIILNNLYLPAPP